MDVSSNEADANWLSDLPSGDESSRESKEERSSGGGGGSWHSQPPLDRFWAAVKRLPRYVQLAANLAMDPHVPISAKALLGFAAVYTVSPIDLVPGFIPVAGQLDDLTVLLFSIRAAIKACPPDVAERQMIRAKIGAGDFDDDLRATRDTAVFLGKKGFRFSRKMVAEGRAWVQSLISRRRSDSSV